MVRTFTAYTAEMDDIAQAVSEVRGMLDFDALLKHSVGLLSCHAEFISSGVIEALSDNLPFPIVGATTIANAARGFRGEMGLTLMVLTSDDVAFSVEWSHPLVDDNPAPLLETYARAAARLSGKPGLMLTYAPLLHYIGGDFFINTLHEASGGVPNFGTLAVDHNLDYHDATVICGKEAARDRCAIVLFEGNIHPTFYVAAISDERVFTDKGVVTASHGNQLQMVNGVSVIDYLASIGINKNEDGSISGINSFPFIIDYNDGTTPVVRVMFALTPDGSAVCGGDIPVGATLSVGRINSETVLSSTAAALDKTLAEKTPAALLMHSCIGRYFALGYEPLAELDAISARLNPTGIPYMLAYSGGELCPVYAQDGGIANRNHNDTFVMCAF